MKIRITPSQQAWLKRVLLKRAMRPAEDKRRTEVINKLVTKLVNIKGESINVDRNGARYLEECCIQYMGNITTIWIPEMNERANSNPERAEAYRKKAAQFGALSRDIGALQKAIREVM